MNVKYSYSLSLYVKIFQFFVDIEDTVQHFSYKIFSMTSMCHLFNVWVVLLLVEVMLQVECVSTRVQ